MNFQKITILITSFTLTIKKGNKNNENRKPTNGERDKGFQSLHALLFSMINHKSSEPLVAASMAGLYSLVKYIVDLLTDKCSQTQELSIYSM